MRPKQEAYDAIETVFKAQGGTGYCGAVKENDCYCAIGALGFSQYGEAMYDHGWATTTEPFGIEHWDLIEAHDDGIREAADLDGIKEGAQFARRALIGTPAYEYVMKRIRVALSA